MFARRYGWRVRVRPSRHLHFNGLSRVRPFSWAALLDRIQFQHLRPRNLTQRARRTIAEPIRNLRQMKTLRRARTETLLSLLRRCRGSPLAIDARDLCRRKGFVPSRLFCKTRLGFASKGYSWIEMVDDRYFLMYCLIIIKRKISREIAINVQQPFSIR